MPSIDHRARVRYQEHIEIALCPQDDDLHFFKYHSSGISHEVLLTWTPPPPLADEDEDKDEDEDDDDDDDDTEHFPLTYDPMYPTFGLAAC